MILHFNLASTKVWKGPPVLVFQNFYNRKFENFVPTFSATSFFVAEIYNVVETNK